MFGQLRMIITLIMIMGIAGAGMYVFKLRADNATLKANQFKLETAITEQNKVLEQQKADFEAQYAPAAGNPRYPATEEIIDIWPLFFSL